MKYKESINKIGTVNLLKHAYLLVETTRVSDSVGIGIITIVSHTVEIEIGTIR
jgi:hypothetical protein